MKAMGEGVMATKAATMNATKVEAAGLIKAAAVKAMGATADGAAMESVKAQAVVRAKGYMQAREATKATAASLAGSPRRSENGEGGRATTDESFSHFQPRSASTYLLQRMR